MRGLGKKAARSQNKDHLSDLSLQTQTYFRSSLLSSVSLSIKHEFYQARNNRYVCNVFALIYCFAGKKVLQATSIYMGRNFTQALIMQEGT